MLAGVIIAVLIGLGVAGWVASLFVRAGDELSAIKAFLTITIAPTIIAYAVSALRDSFYFADVILIPERTDAIDGLVLTGAFVITSIYWASKGYTSQREASQRSENPAPKPEPEEKNSVDIRKRLELLDQLRRDALISEDEYTLKRSKVLSEL